MTDMEQLIEQAKTGDRQSLNMLYSRYRQRSFAICCHITRDKELSEELVDDAFLIAFSRLDQLNDPEKFGGWLSAISARLAMRQMKHPSKNKAIPISHIEGFDVPCETDEPPFTQEELQAAINQLPTGYRKVFTMAVVEGKTHKEIAQALNIEPHSSSSQLYHARAMLQRILGPLMCAMLLVVPLIMTQDQGGDNPQLSAHVPAMPTVGEPTVMPETITNIPTMTVCNTHTALDEQPIAMRQNDTAFTIHTSPCNENPVYTFAPNKVYGNMQSNLVTAHAISGWSVSVAMTRSLSRVEIAQRPHALLLPTVSATSNHGQSVSIANWRDCKRYVLENSSLFSDEVAAALIRIAQSNELDNDGEIIRTESHEPPSTMAVVLHYAIDSVFTLYAGMAHGEYRSYFQTGVGRDRIDERQSVTYLEVPIGVTYNVCMTSRFGCHLSADLSLQLPLSLQRNTSFVVGGQTNDGVAELPIFEQSEQIKSPNIMAGVKVGVHYRLTEHIGFFVEGGISYTIIGGQAIVTYATVHPLVISAQTGLRYTL